MTNRRRAGFIGVVCRILILVVLAVVVGGASQAVYANSNLFANPSFENNLDGWTSSRLAYDDTPDIAAAYGMRRLLFNYTGSLLRLRRSSDNAELDFGYVANSGLDTASISSWLGGASGYVTTWYDQSGNGRNATQTTANSQPLYVASGQNGKPVVRFDGSNDGMIATFVFNQAFSRVSVFKQVSYGYARRIFDSPNGYGVLYEGGISPNLFLYDGITAVSNGALAVGTFGVVSEVHNGAASKLYVNGGNEATGNPGSNVNTGGIIIGNVAALNKAGNIDVAEIVQIAAVVSADTRQTAEQAANTYWDIYVGGGSSSAGIVTRDIAISYTGAASAKIAAQTDFPFTQSVNVGDAANYELAAYAYDNTTGNQGGTVSSSIAQLYYNGAAIATTYTDAGGGWWRLSASVTGAPSARDYGLVVKTGKEVNADEFSLTRASVPSPFYDPYITLSNARFSFRAALAGAHGSGTSILTIATAGSKTFDEDTHNLFPGDLLCLTSTALSGCQGQTTYTVNNAIADDTIGITPALAADLLATDQLVSTQSGTLTVTFQPQNSVESGGHVLLTVPSSTTLYQDGIPDATGWDSALLPADLLGGTGCSGNACFTASGFTVSAVSLSNTGSGTHTINITLSSALDQGTFYDFTLGHTIDPTLQFINPVPQGVSHTRVLADTYTNELKTTNASGSLVYNITLIKTAPQDGVFVSASVEESITYQINDAGNGYGGNIAASTNVAQCNGGSFTTSVATSPYAVPFGSILNMDTFYRAAQSHYVVTNAANGYSLTVKSDGPLSTLGGGATIANGSCDGSCTSSAAGAWSSASNNGFGYTLGDITGTDTAFPSSFRLFDDATPREIMSNSSQTNGSRVALCYQLSVDATQTASYYFNKLTFVATPRF